MLYSHIKFIEFGRMLSLLAAVLGPMACLTMPAASRLVLLDSEVQDWEDDGFDFAVVLGTKSGASTVDLLKSGVYATFVEYVQADFDHLDRRIEEKRQIYDGQVATFPPEWLRSSKTMFQLVGLVIRPDRSLFAKETCGELRAIYRLAYTVPAKNGSLHSRLPMTAMLAWPLSKRKGGCDFKGQHGDPHLAAAAVRTRGERPSRLEVNIQSARWPYTVDSNFSEQSHYLMRVFRLDWDKNVVDPLPLENTPNVAKLLRDAPLKSALLTWLRDPSNLSAIDRGSPLIPEHFVAVKATSVAPLGMKREANRPFSALFNSEDFADLNLSQYATFSSPKTLLRRLDTLSCTGCHQSQAVAGFHFLGFDAPDAPAYDRIKSPFSGYFLAIQSWRKRFATEDPASLVLPNPDRLMPPSRPNQTCGIAGSGFEHISCPQGSACVDGFPKDPFQEMGTCIAKTAKVGDPCDRAELSTTANPLDDQYFEKIHAPCKQGAICATTHNGFPGGMCAGYCAQHTETEACVPTPLLGPFTQCLSERKTFGECLDKHVTNVLLPRCTTTLDCREDYICAGEKSAVGYCVPPYFLAQLAVEFHWELR